LESTVSDTVVTQFKMLYNVVGFKSFFECFSSVETYLIVEQVQEFNTCVLGETLGDSLSSGDTDTIVGKVDALNNVIDFK